MRPQYSAGKLHAGNFSELFSDPHDCSKIPYLPPAAGGNESDFPDPDTLAKSGPRAALPELQFGFQQRTEAVDEILHLAGQGNVNWRSQNKNFCLLQFWINNLHIIFETAFPRLFIPTIHHATRAGLDVQPAGVE